MKETQEGCLSRSMSLFLRTYKFVKTEAACRKDFFDKLARPAHNAQAGFAASIGKKVIPGISAILQSFHLSAGKSARSRRYPAPGASPVSVTKINLLPKVQVEIVAAKVPVRTVIDTAQKALYTGNIGDGKIFVYDVENVVKVRTSQEGYGALQDDK